MLRADGIFSEACVLTLSSDRHACGPEYLQTASVRFYGFVTVQEAFSVSSLLFGGISVQF